MLSLMLILCSVLGWRMLRKFIRECGERAASSSVEMTSQVQRTAETDQLPRNLLLIQVGDKDLRLTLEWIDRNDDSRV